MRRLALAAILLVGCGLPPVVRDESAALVRDIERIRGAWESVRNAYLRDVAGAWRAIADAEFEAALRAAGDLSVSKVLKIDGIRRAANAKIDARLAEMRRRLDRMRGHLEAAVIRARGLRAVLDAAADRAEADERILKMAAAAAKEAARVAIR